MHTNITTFWRKAKNPAAVFVLALIVGGMFGLLAGDQEQRPYCPSPRLRAHFLERKLAFDHGDQSPSSLRPAAPASSPATENGTASGSASSSSPRGEASVASRRASSAEADPFPEFHHAVYPVVRIPDWGAMTSENEWDRPYADMDHRAFVRVPAYDLRELTIPLARLREKRNDPETIRILTAKLFYSTRFFGGRDLDAGEFTGEHAGIDLKVPQGLPVGSVAGGRVRTVAHHDGGLGLHVIVEHRVDGDAYYSIYGHLDSVTVAEGDDLMPGAMLGKAGSTGNSTGPHLHLQIDRGEPGETRHAPYWPEETPDPAEAAARTVHPVAFILRHTR